MTNPKKCPPYENRSPSGPPVLRASCETNFALLPSVPPCGGGYRRARPTRRQSSGRFAYSAARQSCRSPIVTAMPTRGKPSLEPMSTLQRLAVRRVTPRPFRVGAATRPSRTATSNVPPLLGPPSCRAPPPDSIRPRTPLVHQNTADRSELRAVMRCHPKLLEGC